jgi:hypothetical protein
MLTRVLPLLRKAGVSLLMLGGLALQAQLNPNLQVSPTTDFLDLYQAASHSAKPEVLCVLDFSGSMNRLMFHRGFPNNKADEDLTNTTSDYADIYISISGAAPTITNTAYVKSGSITNTSASTTTGGVTVTGYKFSISGVTYQLGYISTGNVTTPAYTGQQLIRPDGTAVTYAIANAIVSPSNTNGSYPVVGANVQGTTGFSASGASGTYGNDVRNWIRAASHVRMSMVDSNNGNKIRTLDLPINWTTLDKLTKAGTLNLSNPLQPSGSVDPVSGSWVDFDTLYQGTPTSNCMMIPTSGSGTTASPYTAATIGNTSGGNINLYRTRYLEWLFCARDSANGAYLIPDALDATVKAYNPAWWLDKTQPQFVTGAYKAFDNGIPNRNRIQSLKESLISTWLKYQSTVFMCFRGLNGSGGTPNSSTGAQPTTLTPASANTTDASNATWYTMNSNPLGAAQHLSKLIPNGGTPLTQSQFSAYVQMQELNRWDCLETGYDKPVECLTHFLILATDGTPNESPYDPTEGANSSPYIGGPIVGNQKVKANIAALTPDGTDAGGTDIFWNTPTMAGVAAHGGNINLGAGNFIRDPKTTTYTLSSGTSLLGTGCGSNANATVSPGNFAPFWIKQRGSGANLYQFAVPHPIQTMTLGMSLGSTYSATSLTNPAGNLTLAPNADPTSPKYRLLAAASWGDPDVTTYQSQVDLVTGTSLGGVLKPFYTVYDSTVGAYVQAKDSACYFDAIDPSTLVKNLDDAFAAINAKASKNVTATPVVPLSGLALSRQVYLTNFQIPGPGPNWTGDLVMFSTRNINNQVQLISNTGAALSQVDPSKAALYAAWSAENILESKLWSSRTVYTRVPATAGNINPGLIKFTDQGADFATLSPYLPASYTSAQKATLVEWMLGADTSKSAPMPNRPSGLMGDIINSTPTVVEYGTQVLGSLPTALSSAYTAHATQNAKIRMLFVGTNRGFLHCFAEVAWDEPTTVVDNGVSSTVTVTKGVADELWAFMPSDHLAYLDYLQTTANTHRFMTDGAPFVYHLDVPAAGAATGNGMVDGSDRAVVIFGLRKGGRSYYALDIHDPANPTMAWTLCSDEVKAASTTLPDARVKAGTPATVKTMVANTGYSTANIGYGRVLYGGATPGFRDVIFLGGGLSESELEKKAYFNNTPLGKNMFALDAYSGDILAAWDFSGVAGIGALNTGVVPFNYFAGSGLVQRLYFTDAAGGLWAVGSGATSVDGFRLDSSQLDRWTADGSLGSAVGLRHVYQGDANDINSTNPAPFNVSRFQVVRTVDPKVTPAAVGIALVSGDRNNPIDQLYGVGQPRGTRPTGHRLTVVFDRQDSKLLGLDSSPIKSGNLTNMTGQSSSNAAVVTPGSGSYYLDTTYGYYINFPAPIPAATGYIPKGINEPTVLSGVLFYSYFTPTSGGVCLPGGGFTFSYRVCDVMAPVDSGDVADPSIACTNGQVGQWAGVASNFGKRGTVAVSQAGGVVGTDASGNMVGTGMIAIGTIQGSRSERFPKPRVWRSVQ